MNRKLILIGLCLLLSGCGKIKSTIDRMLPSDDTVEPPAELVEFEASIDPEELWDSKPGKGAAKLFLKLAPVANEDAIYTAERKGRVSAVSVTNGRLIWQVDANVRISGGPGVGENLVMIGTSDGEVLALSKKTGEFQWRARVSSEILAAPKEQDGIVVVRTIDGKLSGLDATGGRRLWIYDRTVPSLTLRGTSSPAIFEDLVVAGFDSGRLVAIELTTGRLVWETQIAIPTGRSDLERMVDIDAEPLIDNRTIYVATFQGRVAAVSVDTGRVEWSRNISSHAGLAIDGTNVYLTDAESNVWALDRLTGSSLWKQEQMHGRNLTAPAAIGDYVVVGDLEGYLHWLKNDDGEFAARVRMGRKRLIAPPLETKGVLVAYSTSGSLVAYRP
jgi:outer membrane protein assembly factor BamB